MHFSTATLLAGGIAPHFISLSLSLFLLACDVAHHINVNSTSLPFVFPFGQFWKGCWKKFAAAVWWREDRELQGVSAMCRCKSLVLAFFLSLAAHSLLQSTPVYITSLSMNTKQERPKLKKLLHPTTTCSLFLLCLCAMHVIQRSCRFINLLCDVFLYLAALLNTYFHISVTSLSVHSSYCA